MLTEKNFPDALKIMNFTQDGNTYKKIFPNNVVMKVDFNAKKLFYPAQIENHTRNTELDDSHRENLVVFECVNRLLDKGYNPQDIWLEKNWQLGHSPKSGRADICVSTGGKVLFIIECKTAGNEFNHELSNMQADGGQLFSYWQQEQSCQWLMLYASDFKDDKLTFSAKSISCNEDIYREAHTVPERFKIWSERYEKVFLDDVIFHDETIAYQIGVKPLRKGNLHDFSENDAVVNKFEEILRHNAISNKAKAFDVLVALFICKLADETLTDDRAEVSFQFKHGSDIYETFQDRLQKLYAEGMERFMKEPITYVPLNRVDELLFQNGQVRREELSIAFKAEFRKLKFFNNNAFTFIDVHNEKLFYLNGKVLVEVVRMLQNYKIIGSKDLQTLGDLFEQLLDKGFKQNEGQFFTPIPITRFIWDSLPLNEIISRNHGEPPKIIDYACGAGHFLTEGYQAVNDCFIRNNLSPPVKWESDKLFGVEKDDRLARVSKISLFMHGANEGKIKFGEGLENYPDENISPETFDILVANPPYSIKGFKVYLQLANENFDVLDKISVKGSEIETLFAERISQLIKPYGVAAVILPDSILSNENKSFIAARESLLKNFYIRAIVQLGSKTFGATSTKTVILFLQRIFDPPERAQLLKDSAEIILRGEILPGDEEDKIFPAYLEKIGKSTDDYRNFIASASTKAIEIEREKIIYFGLTYRQRTLIISAPDSNDEQEKFLGYGWSNAKGREGIIHKKRGGLLFDNDNRAADNTLAALIRAAFKGERLNLRGLEKYYHYATLADMLDFDSTNFNKKITLAGTDYSPVEYSGKFPLGRLGEYITQIRGVSYKPKDLHLELSDNSFILLRANNISNGKINHDEVQYISREKVSAAQMIREGDILMSASSGSLQHVGKAALCTENVVGETFGAFCKVIRSTGKLLPEYIAVYFSTPDYRKIISHLASGSNINNIRNEHIDNLKIPLPPLEVQKQIVDEFRAIAAQIDSADDTITNLDADIKTKFAELFEDYAGDKKYSFANLCKDDTASGVKFLTSEYLKAGEVPIIDQGANEIAGYMNLADSPPPYDDLPCIIFGDHTEVFKIVRERFYLGADGTKIIIPIDRTKLNATFLFYMLREEYQPLGGYARHFKNLKTLKLYLPPLELQEQFAAYVANCEALKKSARGRREELIAARAALVAKYFR